MRVSNSFAWLVVASLVLPAVIGGLLTWSWWGALTGFFWGGLVRMGVLHHVTWSINSICHMIGKRTAVCLQGQVPQLLAAGHPEYG